MTAPRHTWWSPDEEEKVRWMRNRGLSHKHIAYALGRSSSAVSNRASLLGLTKQKPQSWPSAPPRKTIVLAEIADWYERGCLIESFDPNSSSVIITEKVATS